MWTSKKKTSNNISHFAARVVLSAVTTLTNSLGLITTCSADFPFEK